MSTHVERAHENATARIDARGPQFTAAVTAIVLIAVLALPTPASTALIAVQAVLFAVGAGLGVQHTPTSWVFRRLVRPRLSGSAEFEDPQPPRFAQAVGLVFAVVAFAGYASGLAWLGLVATGFALVAALLNALFRFCLGCELYLLLKRATA
jgi:disulfide bond formation protein DsbB